MRVKQLALAPLQPLLAKYLKLKIAGGHRLRAGAAHHRRGHGERAPACATSAGSTSPASRSTKKTAICSPRGRTWAPTSFTASLGPNRLDIPELRVVEANAKLIIEDDRSFNAARLLVQPAGAAAQSRRSAGACGAGCG